MLYRWKLLQDLVVAAFSMGHDMLGRKSNPRREDVASDEVSLWEGILHVFSHRVRGNARLSRRTGRLICPFAVSKLLIIKIPGKQTCTKDAWVL